MDKYEQLRLFDTSVYDALVQPRVDPWETFLKDTKAATFNESDKDKEIAIRVKPGRKTRKKPSNGS